MKLPPEGGTTNGFTERIQRFSSRKESTPKQVCGWHPEDWSGNRQRMSHRRHLLMLLFTLFAAAVVSLVALEIALRLFLPQPLGISYRSEMSLPVHTPNFNYHSTDPIAGEWDLHTRFNSMGLRDREYTREKPDDTFRILVLGDSITEALQVEDHEVYTEVLEASLNSPPSATRYEVINAGVSGYGTGDQLKLYAYLGESLEPNLVIVQMSLINDLSENLFCRWYRVEEGEILRLADIRPGFRVRLGEFLGRHFHSAQIFRHFLHLYTGKGSERLEGIASHKKKYHALLYDHIGSEGDFDEDWEVTFTYLEELHRRVSESDARFLLLIRPLDPDVEGTRTSQYPRNHVLTFCENKGIDLLDLTQIFAEKSRGDIRQIRFEVDSHWIPQGHAWAAEALFEHFAECEREKRNGVEASASIHTILQKEAEASTPK